METIEITGEHPNFDSLEVYDVLQLVKPYANQYIWSIKLIEAYDGDTKLIIDKGGLELEEYCNKSYEGYITDFNSICELSLVFNDIVEIGIIACKKEYPLYKTVKKLYKIGKKYKIWLKYVNYSDISIARFDSSWWELGSTNPEIMDKFKGLLKTDNKKK